MVKYFNNPENIEVLEKLNGILQICPLKNDNQNVELNGKSVVFTGKFHSMTRQQAKIQAEQLGYKVLIAVSSNTNYLVYGEDAGETKLNKAREIGVNVISEKEWKLMNNI